MFKKVFLKLVLSALVVFMNLSTTFAYGWDWDISSFNTTINIQEDGSIIVKEEIVADFSREQHHGIFRIIPIKYKDNFGNNLALRFDLLSIEDENGNPWSYQETRSNGNVSLQIGDAEQYLKEPVTFIINYKLNRVLTSFEDHDELYFNATGNEWDVPINAAESEIIFPENVNSADLKATCFIGTFGSTSQDCKTEVVDNKIRILTLKLLQPQEGLTVVAGFPKGTVDYPSFWQKIEWFLADNFGYLLPVFFFILLYYLWATRGRDPKIEKDTIMPIYSSPDFLTPSEIGTLIDETVDVKDITSTMIDLAIKGYIQIIETKEKGFLGLSNETNFEFKKTKIFEDDKKLKRHEKAILLSIFGNGDSKKLNDLENEFYKDLPDIRNRIYDELIEKGYFIKDPSKVRASYKMMGYILLMSQFALWDFADFSISLPVGIAVSGLLFIVFSKYMPAKTKKGVEVFYKIKGLEEYINTGEKDRIAFQEKENIFEKLLPYAITLGMAEKWSKAFEGIYKTPPHWYTSSDPSFNSHFNSFFLYHRLNRLTQNSQTVFQSRPRSSGSAWGGGSGFRGGFSGGGFGGGGGRAW